jgi:hypothetical protein
LGKQVFQSRLIFTPVEAPKGPRRLEAGQTLLLQTVTPAAGVRLTSDPRRGTYGAKGSVLFKASDSAGDLWCLRGTTVIGVPGPFYCYRDTDDDGIFDQLYERAFPPNESAFQIFRLGANEGLAKPVSYEPAPPPAFREILGLRYKGVRGGYIDPTDHIAVGEVTFEVIAGKDARSALVVRSHSVEIDADGRGFLPLDSGQVITIDSVEVGGGARIELTGPVASGEGVALPALTKDNAVFITRRLLEWRKAAPPPPKPVPMPPPIEARPIVVAEAD